MWEPARSVDHGVLLESWWFRPRDLAFAEEGLRRARARTIVEIWCEVPPELARDRFAARTRDNALYQDAQRLTAPDSRAR
jgi:predicted kinase